MATEPFDEEAQEAHGGHDDDWQIVTVADALLEAEVAADALEAAGVPASVESVGNKSHEVLVPEEHLAKARELLRTLREGDGEPSRAYRTRIDAAKRVGEALLALHTGELDAALERYQAAVALDARCAPAHVGIAVIARKRGDLPTAYARLRHATDLYPQDRNAWMTLASVCLDLQKPEEAGHAYDKVLEIYPDDVRAHRGKGFALTTAWRLTDAMKCFAEALDIDPDDVDSLVQDALCHYRMGDFKKAIERAEDAIELDEKQVGARVVLGRAHWHLKQLKESERAIAEAHDLAPESLEILCYLAQTKLDRGDLPAARALLDRAAQKNPAHGLLKLSLAKLHAAPANPKRDLAAAELLLKEAVTQAPTNPDFQNALAEHFLAAGKQDEARRAAEEAARIAPEVPSYRETLARCKG